MISAYIIQYSPILLNRKKPCAPGETRPGKKKRLACETRPGRPRLRATRVRDASGKTSAPRDAGARRDRRKIRLAREKHLKKHMR